MGQQQFMFITLGAIVIAVAIAVSVIMFRANAQELNRQAIVSDLVNYGAKAQRYYLMPGSLAGGNHDFNGFSLNSLDAINENGTFAATTTPPTGTALQDSSTAPISASSQIIYIVASGQEEGENGATPVKAFVTITFNGINTQILN